MGFRFTLETANTVANLSFGKVLSCYRDIRSSPERYWEFKEFLTSFDSSFFEGDECWDDRRRFGVSGHWHYRDTIQELSECLDEKRNWGVFGPEEAQFEHDDRYRRDRKLIECLGNLSDLMQRCKIKSLLLPRPVEGFVGRDDDFMTEPRVLKRLLRWHPSDSCLILQPQERPNREGITIFDAFPNFDYALNQIDLWPAVMFWNSQKDFVFAPVDSLDKLEEMYAILHYEKQDSFDELKKYVYANRKRNRSNYYFHLSDLHLGANSTLINERRLKKLIDKQIDSFAKSGDESTINFIITGDIVDSPRQANTTKYFDFRDFISSRSSNSDSPLIVLGNHDVNLHGLAFGDNNQSLIASIGNYPKIAIDDNIKVIFLLLNSNTSGMLAEGEVGVEQLSEIGNLLDDIQGYSDYKKVAVLHHHLMRIPEPDWCTKRWYKKLVPSSFLEKALRLRDADYFKEWLTIRGVKLVLHGHKHVPFIGRDGDITVVACGSSTGQVQNIDPRKTYISYNILKFNRDTVTCTMCAEEMLGSGALDVQTSTLDY